MERAFDHYTMVTHELVGETGTQGTGSYLYITMMEYTYNGAYNLGQM